MAGVAQTGDGGKPEHFDVVIVGSGFGGSVMAARLAAEGWSVCVLERGKAYPPGSFPRSPYDMARNSWDPSAGTYGLFDLWKFRRLSALVSSGLGGGSLIYSNVMMRRDPAWFDGDRLLPDGETGAWPVRHEELAHHYDAVEQMIGVSPYPLEKAPYDKAGRAAALRDAADAMGWESTLPNLAVSFASSGGADPVPGAPLDEWDNPNMFGLPRTTCRLVAECNFGCNSGSKNSLDLTYLSRASRKGATIRTLAEVRSFAPVKDGFVIDYRRHDPERTSRGAPTVRLHASRLVLAAGTLGTTYLLLRNRLAFPGLSPRLGRRFSGNGDFLGLILRAHSQTADGRTPRVLGPNFGPAIMAAATVPRSSKTVSGPDPGPEMYLEDAGYPDVLNWMVQETVPLVPRLLWYAAQRAVTLLRKRPDVHISSALRQILGDGGLSATSTPLGAMGRDVPDGRFVLRGALLDLDWSPDRSTPYFNDVRDHMHEVGDKLGAHALVSRWLNLLVTVHPLGGCSMADNRNLGVVDSRGRVFEGRGLIVADGSVMPGPVGANPSLTIAALADLFADQLIDDGKCWKERSP